MRYPGFLGYSYRSSSYMADSEELINFYVEKNESPNAPSPYCLLPTPGFVSVGNVAEGPSRGSCTANGLTYFVAGYRIYEWNGATATARGTLTAADTNPATLCWNGDAGGQLFITSGDVGYTLNLTTFVLTVVLASGAAMGSYLDGFFLALDAATGTLQISDLLDGLTWNPTQIAQRSDAADPWVAMTVLHAEIWLMGSRTSSVWFNAGSSPFPFEMIPNAKLEQGIAAPFSTPRDVSPLLWVSANALGARMVLMAQGYSSVKVSDYALDKALQDYDTVADAISMSFQVGGHTFFALIFPDADESWLYSAETGWSKWRFWNTVTSAWEAVRVRTHVFTPEGIHLMGDRSSGMLYRMGLDLFTDVDGGLILRERTPPRLSAPDQVRFTVPSIELVMDVGVGTIGSDTTDPSVNPQAMLVTSRDGGRTFGPERTSTIGPVGAYNTRVLWTQCGQARNRVDRFRFAANVPIRITDAIVTMRLGTS